jgi:aspartyl-tRNA(Asn)/glutamyl-tRNA(Gln) amidotransferase subunit B
MQEGSFRCDVNVSVRPKGTEKLGTRREIKNLNSFKFMQQAIEYETQWQIDTLEDGGTIQQATVLFNPDTGETRAMRSKEEANDYRYFPDPDLLPLVISEQDINSVRLEMGESQDEKYRRYINDLLLFPQDAYALTSSRATDEYFESVLAELRKIAVPTVTQTQDVANAKSVANWVINSLGSYLNKANLDISQSPVSAIQLAGLLAKVFDRTLSNNLAKEVFDAIWNGEGDANSIIEKKGLKQVSDSGAIEAIVDRVLAANAAMVAEYKAGKEKAFNGLVGQCMKASQGKANPAQVNEILKKKLA